MDPDIRALVSDDACHVSRRVFSDTAVYRLEQERIFVRSWLYLCHDSQLPAAGDFLTTWMGEVPVIVARSDDGRIHASVNRCSHRGLPVCRVDQGNARRFVCPYHNWSYTLEGHLAAIPQERHLGQGPDKSTLGLPPVPRIEQYRGLVFGCLDAEAPSLDSYLGDMRFYLDTFFDRFPGGVEVVGPAHKWRLRCNWKLPVENQLGDVGHAPYLHGGLLAGTPVVEEIDRYGFNAVPVPGHGAAVRLLPPDSTDEQRLWGLEGLSVLHPDPELRRYLSDVQAQVADRLGPVRARLRGLTYGVYPNLSFLWANATLRVSHPRGPGEVEYWSWWVVPREAPAHIKAILRGNYTFFFGPGGVLEQEDAEAWAEQYKGSRIALPDERPYYYGLGHGEEARHPELPGLVGSSYNEHYARQFYLRWRRDLERGGRSRA